MSFSGNVKEELARNKASARHCKIAEIAGLLCFGGRIVTKDDKEILIFHTENVSVAKRLYLLGKDVFDLRGRLDYGHSEVPKKNRNYTVSIDNPSEIALILKAVKFLRPEGNALITQNTCCKRAFIRGAFQAAGSMSDPEKSYHMEVISTDKAMAEQLKSILNFFSLDAKIVIRKKYYVVYMKEGEKIVDALNIMEAHVALMNLENIRILKDMRNTVNRRVNCETANINKTVSAAVKQVEDIEFIMKHKGLSYLSQGLQDIAYLRLEHPEATLKELGDLLSPPVGKSGVNHRLKKIEKIADDMRLGGYDGF